VAQDFIKILTVCTHNRTRSVMSMAMLQAGLDDRLGPGKAMVRSLGFGPEGLPAISDAVDAMKRRGLDVSGHRSRQVTATNAEAADLILTAEKDHVIKIGAAAPEVFRRTFTLPEFCDLASVVPAGPGGLSEWARELSHGRRVRGVDCRDRSDVRGCGERSGSSWLIRTVGAVSVCL
jgi:protein-tyrosine-phosphatase